jgi:hypothetical protein
MVLTSVRGWKNYNTMRNRTHDLQICSSLSQLTATPRALNHKGVNVTPPYLFRSLGVNSAFLSQRTLLHGLHRLNVTSDYLPVLNNTTLRDVST